MGSAAGNEMVLNFYRGFEDELRFVGTGVMCACDRVSTNGDPELGSRL